MEAFIRKWGNSPALRLPSAVLKEAGYRLDQKVDLAVEDGNIIIRPAAGIQYDLDTLLEGIDSSNLHGEFDFGGPVGKEAL
jgi:antitoxin MazE